MESAAHLQLKRFALAFLLRHDCLAAAAEVRCPIARYRIDAAGYLDSRTVPTRAAPGLLDPGGESGGRERQPCEPRTAIIECKQSREDFIRDTARLDRLLALRDHLLQLRAHLEENHVKVHEPHLRQSGTSLFAECEAWDFSASRLASYRNVLARLERVEARLYGQTKFFRLAQYRLADRLYIAGPRGVIRPRELPHGWGLLECPAKALHEPPMLFDAADPALTVTVPSPEHNSPARFRARMLRNIAIAATRAALSVSLPSWPAARENADDQSGVRSGTR